MKFNILLNELLKKEFTKDDIKCSMYVNPTQKELQSCFVNLSPQGRYLRFAINNKTKEFIVWRQDVLHYYGASQLGWTYHGDPQILYGEGYYDQGKLKELEFASLGELPLNKKGSEYISSVYKQDWSWAEKWAEVKKGLDFYMFHRKNKVAHKLLK